MIFFGTRHSLGKNFMVSAVHLIVCILKLSEHQNYLPKSGIGLALILKICPPTHCNQLYFVQLLQYFFWVVSLWANSLNPTKITKTMVTFPGKNTHSVGRVWAKMPRKATCLLQDYDWGPGVAIEWQPAPRKGHQEWIKFKVMPLRLLECHRKPQCLPVKSRRILDFCSFLSLCNS